MLGRAARCLKTGLLQPPSQCKHALHSRRMLHSAFWRHGAGDLDIPAWCFHTMKALFEPEHATGQGDNEKHNGPHGCNSGGLFLDFLYPEKTQAMIKRLSMYGLRRWHRHMRSLTNHTGFRYFVSNPRRDRERATPREASQVTGDQSRNVADGEKIDSENASLTPEEALQDLNRLLKTHERGEYQESWKQAWGCYMALNGASKTPELLSRLISLLGSSPRSLDARRAVRVFDSLPSSERSIESLTRVILALLKLKETGKAVLLHTQAMRTVTSDAPIEGTKVLIAHLIAQRQWQLVFYAYDNCSSFFGSRTEALQLWSSDLFKSVLQMPGLTGKVMSLLRTVAEYPYILSNNSPSSTKFLVGLVDSIVDYDISFGVRRDLEVVEILKQLDLCSSETFEKIGLLVLNSHTSPAKSRRESALAIYRLYSQVASFRPSKRYLHTLLKVAVDTDDQETVLKLLPDWYQHYGLPSTTLAGLIMKGSARAGDISRVNEFMTKFINHGQEVTWKLFYPILHVYALHGEPEAVQDQMSHIEAEHSLKPDITSYNILLHAYQRTDNLDGTLMTLSKLLSAGVQPDHYTIGTIMSVAAGRGDVELCEQMLHMARKRNIRRSTVMNDCLILAYLNNYEPMKAEAVARQLTYHTRQFTSTRMWNQILSHYAIADRPANLTGTLRVARQMQKLKVRYDGMSYAAIMRAYAVKRRTDMARRILHTVLVKKNLPVLPIHYAIIIDGYANQLNTEKGLRMQAEMLKRGIEPTISTQLALQNLHATAARRKFLIDRASHPGNRLDILDETLEESLQALDLNAVNDRSPQLQSSRFRSSEIYPAAYFDLSLTFYGKIRAFDVVKTLIEKYQASTHGPDVPLRFLATFMDLHYRESAHNEVDRYWALAKSSALSSAKVAATYRGDTHLPPIRRKLLARHLDVLLRSLDARGGPARAANMLAAVNELFSAGFDLDNRNWNIYVQLLATRHDYLDAFRLCERNLMASFPGWREDEPRVKFFQATLQKSEGTEFLGPRYTYLQPGELRATYKTMVRFAWVLRRLRRAAPFDKKMADVLEQLEKEAPRTVKAVLEMPMLEHPIATHVLGARAQGGMRRRLPE